MTERKTIKELIVAFLQSSNQKSFSTEALSQALGMTKSSDFKLFVKAVAILESEGVVVFTKKGKVQLVTTEPLVTGIFRQNERGFGFVTIADDEDDVYISKEKTGYALDGDQVKIRILSPADYFSDRGAEGEIVEITQRNLTQVVGEFVAYTDEEIAESDLYGYVEPKDKKMQQYRVYVVAEGVKPVSGNVCIVTIRHYPEPGYSQSLEGYVTKIVGHKDDPGMDILSIVMQHGIPVEFPDHVLAEADQVPDSITQEDLVGRRDLRDQVIVTIDGADAKDLDDAVTVRKLANGHFFLGVHIADVSYYVTEDSPLDGEAFTRGTSVYLTDRVIPMLPRRLSNGICSLNPKVPRLTLSCEMEIDNEGHVVNYDIFPSVIQTTERMTYQAVNEILEDENPETMAHYQELVPMFHEMADLHEILEKMREKRGAISFEDHEAKVLVNETGHPEDIILRERHVGERLIESFMLAANETVAEHFNRLKLPFIYRIHEQPKEEKVQRFFEFAAIFGYVIKGSKESISPKELQKILDEVAGKPEEPVINTMLLRSMQQARYSEDSYGHYGLAAEYYTHFTSPIRRYPDLIVHRLIRAYHDKPVKEELIKHWQEKLPEIAEHSSKMERRAVEAERDTDALKKAEFMEDKIGEEYDGIISSVTKFGMFVELPNTVEGLVHVNSLKQDYFHFVEQHMALVGERTGMVLRLGGKVRIRVTKADVETREVDFELVEIYGGEEQNVKILQRTPKKRNKNEKNGDNRYNKKKPKKKYPSQEKKAGNKKGKKPFYKSVGKKGKSKKK